MQDLDQLRDILLAPEREAMEALRRRQTDPEQRASDLAEVLPSALMARSKDPQALAAALDLPVALCIRRAIERDPNAYAEVLFPVMGPAIRRAIGEALKALVQSINQAVEHSLSPRSLAWRWEAWRSGQPFGAVLLRHTLVYRVEAAYLIQNHSGLLIGHALAATHSTLKDEDAVSAMLTAIQGFMQDAFTGPGSDSGEHRLESVEIGGRTLWVISGPSASLACLILGIPPLALRERLEAILGEIHAAYRRDLSEFRGDRSALPDLTPLLEQCLHLEYREPLTEARPPARWPWALAALLVLGALGWHGWRTAEQHRLLAQVEQRLRAAPGILLVGRREQGDTTYLDLLRDPLAADPRGLILQPGLDRHLTLSVTPFQSLEPGLVLERARRQLQPPASVTLTLSDGTLALAGRALPEWIARVRASLVLPAGVAALDSSGLTADLSGLPAQVHAALAPPAGVEVEVQGSEVRLAGAAPWAWIQDVPRRLTRVPLVSACTNAELEPAEWREAAALGAELGALHIPFGEGGNPLPGSMRTLERAAQIVTRLAGLNAAVPLRAGVRVIGHSDGIGTEPWNLRLRQQRAELVRAHLAAGPDEAAILRAEGEGRFVPSPVPDPNARRVDFSLDLSRPEVPPCLP